MNCVREETIYESETDSDDTVVEDFEEASSTHGMVLPKDCLSNTFAESRMTQPPFSINQFSQEPSNTGQSEIINQIQNLLLQLNPNELKESGNVLLQQA